MVLRAYLVVQWLRNRLVVQGTSVQSLPGRLPHSKVQLSLCATATEAHLPRADSPRTREATAMRDPRTQPRAAPTHQ